MEAKKDVMEIKAKIDKLLEDIPSEADDDDFDILDKMENEKKVSENGTKNTQKSPRKKGSKSPRKGAKIMVNGGEDDKEKEEKKGEEKEDETKKRKKVKKVGVSDSLSKNLLKKSILNRHSAVLSENPSGVVEEREVVMVTDDFSSTQESVLSVSRGELFLVVNKTKDKSGFWWYVKDVRDNKRKGYIPAKSTFKVDISVLSMSRPEAKEEKTKEKVSLVWKLLSAINLTDIFHPANFEPQEADQNDGRVRTEEEQRVFPHKEKEQRVEGKVESFHGK